MKSNLFIALLLLAPAFSLAAPEIDLVKDAALEKVAPAPEWYMDKPGYKRNRFGVLWGYGQRSLERPQKSITISDGSEFTLESVRGERVPFWAFLPLLPLTRNTSGFQNIRVPWFYSAFRFQFSRVKGRADYEYKDEFIPSVPYTTDFYSLNSGLGFQPSIPSRFRPFIEGGFSIGYADMKFDEGSALDAAVSARSVPRSGGLFTYGYYGRLGLEFKAKSDLSFLLAGHFGRTYTSEAVTIESALWMNASTYSFGAAYVY